MRLNTSYIDFVNEKQINLIDVGFSLGIWFFALLYFMVVAIEIYLYLTNEKNIVYEWFKKIKNKGIFSLFKDPRFIIFFISSLLILFLMFTHLDWFLIFTNYLHTTEFSEADTLYKIHVN